MSYDVIILGLGAMGSAAAMHLAERGVRVLGLEQFTSPHDQGSSHGGSRMIRQAYFESAFYIPLVLRAYELWRRLERDTDSPLLHITGGLNIGARDGDLVRHTIEASEDRSVPFEVLDGAAVRKRFPAFTPLEGDVGVYEPNAGYLLPEECIRAHLACSQHAGAELKFDERVLSWTADGNGVEVQTSRGYHSAAHLVIAGGPWANQTLRGAVPLRVTRQVMAWIQPVGGVAPFLPEHFPVYLSESVEGSFHGYGFPALDGPDGGVKAAVHGSETECTPESIDRGVHVADFERIVAGLKVRLPALDGALVRAKTCMYTMTPDEHFVIGAHPTYGNCSIACGFSGHGFKFSSVVGEVLADLATKGETSHPIAQLSPLRFVY